MLLPMFVMPAQLTVLLVPPLIPVLPVLLNTLKSLVPVKLVHPTVKLALLLITVQLV